MPMEKKSGSSLTEEKVAEIYDSLSDEERKRFAFIGILYASEMVKSCLSALRRFKGDDV